MKLVTICFLFLLTVDLSVADSEVAVMTACMGDIENYLETPSKETGQSTSCTFNIKSPPSIVSAVLAVRNAKRGIYVFDERTGSAKFFELKKAKTFQIGKQKGFLSYTFPSAKEDFLIIYSDKLNTDALSGGDIEKEKLSKIKISQKEYDVFISEKKIPKSELNADKRKQILSDLKYQKHVAAEEMGSEKDPQNKVLKDISGEGIDCFPSSINNLFNAAVPLQTLGVLNDADDEAARTVLKKRT